MLSKRRRLTPAARALALALTSTGALAAGAASGCRQTVVLVEGRDGGAGQGGNGGQGGFGGFGFDGGFDGQGGAGPGCRQLAASLRIPDVIISLDRSTAMQAPLDDRTTRHEAARQRLEDLVQRYQAVIHFGYQEFPAVAPSCGPTGGSFCCPGEVFSPTPISSLAFDQFIHACTTSPCVSADRPTGEALRRCRQALSTGDGERDRYVLLVTGGEPTCTSGSTGGPGPGPNAACNDAQSSAANLANAGVRTMVVVVGNDLGTYDCLSNVALAGIPDRSMPPFYNQARSASDLNDLLSKLLADVAKDACHVDLVSGVQSGQRNEVSVFLNGRQIPRNDVDGWDFDGNNNTNPVFHITLHGDACQAVANGQAVVEVLQGNCSGP